VVVLSVPNHLATDSDCEVGIHVKFQEYDHSEFVDVRFPKDLFESELDAIKPRRRWCRETSWEIDHSKVEVVDLRFLQGGFVVTGVAAGGGGGGSSFGFGFD
jgi:hypothetical protein